MVMTPRDRWLYQNQEFINASEQMIKAHNALFYFDEKIAERRARLATKYKAARVALQERREQLMAAHSAEQKK
jgi:hypothetical protein